MGYSLGIMATATATLIVTKGELKEIATLEAEYAQATHAAAEAEKKLKPLRLALAEKVLGVESSAELKTLSPVEIETRLIRRMEQKKWRAEPQCPYFTFVKTYEGRVPPWKQLLINEIGESAVEMIAADTPKQYSYRVEVT